VEGIDERSLTVPSGFSLHQTCGPVAWSRGRSPDMDWLGGTLVWTGWEEEHAVWRAVRQRDNTLIIRGTATPCMDLAWAQRVLGIEQAKPHVDDPVINTLAAHYPGLRSFSHGSLYGGLVTSIVGQSISVAAAAVVQTRLSLLFNHPVRIGGRRFVPLPRPDQLAAVTAETVKTSGVTMRRAAALVRIAGIAAEGGLPSDDVALAAPDATEVTLRALPLVGPWTARSALLWGLGSADAFPSGDIALLRAARRTYDRPELDLGDLDRMSDGWRPARGLAARLLWTDLLGTASDS
jgi:3-methyladenine DNA glycosylase/8-oxoguanine DNA glycosylase